MNVLVMGGGGVKGMAHVGAWKAIEESGLRIDAILGTSIGALVGACLAGGAGWDVLAPQALALGKADIVTLNRWALLLNGIRQPSVFEGETLRRYIASVLPVRTFEEMEIPVSMNAVQLYTGREEWFGAVGRRDVPLADAVYASCALPLFYPPAEIDGKYYVDGGVADALPVRKAAALGATRIIAVDVGAGAIKDARDTVSKGLVAIHHRVFDIMAYERKRQILESWEGPALTYVRPSLENVSTFDFSRTQFFLEEGYRATKRALGQPPGTRPVLQEAG